jgi:hypothetical protein
MSPDQVFSFARRPSHTTGHTGPYHGGSTGLCLCGNVLFR